MLTDQQAKRWGVTDDCRDCSHPPKGWIQELDRLMELLREIPGWDQRWITQVKAKYGWLCCWTRPPEGTDPQVIQESERLIERCKARVRRLCTNCGQEDTVPVVRRQDLTNGWISARCQRCFDALKVTHFKVLEDGRID